LRKELLQTSLAFWDELLTIDSKSAPKGVPGPRNSDYRRHRALCLARLGEHEHAAAEAEALWANPLTRDGEMAYDLARVYGLSAAAAMESNERELAERYADQAMTILHMAATAGFFEKDPENLASEPAFVPLQTAQGLQEPTARHRSELQVSVSKVCCMF
jgi:hypothetical protein